MHYQYFYCVSNISSPLYAPLPPNKDCLYSPELQPEVPFQLIHILNNIGFLVDHLTTLESNTKYMGMCKYKTNPVKIKKTGNKSQETPKKVNENTKKNAKKKH